MKKRHYGIPYSVYMVPLMIGRHNFMFSMFTLTFILVGHGFSKAVQVTDMRIWNADNVPHIHTRFTRLSDVYTSGPLWNLGSFFF